MDIPPVVGQVRSGPDGRTVPAALLVAVAVAAFGVPYGLLWSALAPDIPVIKVDGGVVPADPVPEQMVAGDGWFTLLGLAFGVLAAVATWLLARRRRGPLALFALAAGAVASGVLAGWLGQRIGLAGYQRALAAASPGAHLTHPPDLRVAEIGWWLGFIPKVRGVLLVEAFGAVATYTLLAGWSRHGSLRAERPAAWRAATPPPAAQDAPLTACGAPREAWASAWRPGEWPADVHPDSANDPAPGAGGQTGAVSSGSSAPPDPPAAPAPPAHGEAASPRD